MTSLSTVALSALSDQQAQAFNGGGLPSNPGTFYPGDLSYGQAKQTLDVLKPSEAYPVGLSYGQYKQSLKP